MIVIVAGSRKCTDRNLIETAILDGIKELNIKPTKFLHGDAQGVDKIAGDICQKMGYNVVKYPAKWKDVKGKPENEVKQNAYGKYWVKAGFARNLKMAEDADALIAIDLGTGGTQDMISQAEKLGLKIYVYRPETEECFGFSFWE